TAESRVRAAGSVRPRRVRHPNSDPAYHERRNSPLAPSEANTRPGAHEKGREPSSRSATEVPLDRRDQRRPGRLHAEQRSMVRKPGPAPKGNVRLEPSTARMAQLIPPPFSAVASM